VAATPRLRSTRASTSRPSAIARPRKPLSLPGRIQLSISSCYGGTRALWLQLGIRSVEARAIAEEAGLAQVEDRCLKVGHARLLGRRSGRQAAG